MCTDAKENVPAASPPADAQLDPPARIVRRGNESVEKRGSIDGVVPGERKRLVRERKRKVDPIKSPIVDLLWGKRARRPVRIVSHYERAKFVGERGRRLRPTGHVQKRSGTREKREEDEDRHRNNKRPHIKQIAGEDVGGEKLNAPPFCFWILACDAVSPFPIPSPRRLFARKRTRLLKRG